MRHVSLDLRLMTAEDCVETKKKQNDLNKYGIPRIRTGDRHNKPEFALAGKCAIITCRRQTELMLSVAKVVGCMAVDGRSRDAA